MAHRFSLISLATLGFLSMGASNCGGGGGGPQCPQRGSASAMMLVKNGNGLSSAVGQVVVTENEGRLYVDVIPDAPYVALNTATVFEHPSLPTLIFSVTTQIYRQLPEERLEFVGDVDQTLIVSPSASAVGTGGGGGGGPENCPRN